jgi:hypothetical protein
MRLQPLRHDRRQDQEEAKDKDGVDHAAGTEYPGQYCRQTEGRVNRHHDGQSPKPEAPLSIGVKRDIEVIPSCVKKDT